MKPCGPVRQPYSYSVSCPINCSKIPAQSPETVFFHSRSCLVKTSFGHILAIEQSKRDVFITEIKNIFNIFYGPSEKCKAFYSVNCILVSIVDFFTFAFLNGKRTGSFAQCLSAADLGYIWI
jgi:hypothetical protein